MSKNSSYNIISTTNYYYLHYRVRIGQERVLLSLMISNNNNSACRHTYKQEDIAGIEHSLSDSSEEDLSDLLHRLTLRKRLNHLKQQISTIVHLQKEADEIKEKIKYLSAKIETDERNRNSRNKKRRILREERERHRQTFIHALEMTFDNTKSVDCFEKNNIQQPPSKKIKIEKDAKGHRSSKEVIEVVDDSSDQSSLTLIEDKAEKNTNSCNNNGKIINDHTEFSEESEDSSNCQDGTVSEEAFRKVVKEILSPTNGDDEGVEEEKVGYSSTSCKPATSKQSLEEDVKVGINNSESKQHKDTQTYTTTSENKSKETLLPKSVVFNHDSFACKTALTWVEQEERIKSPLCKWCKSDTTKCHNTTFGMYLISQTKTLMTTEFVYNETEVYKWFKNKYVEISEFNRYKWYKTRFDSNNVPPNDENNRDEMPIPACLYLSAYQECVKILRNFVRYGQKTEH